MEIRLYKVFVSLVLISVSVSAFAEDEKAAHQNGPTAAPSSGAAPSGFQASTEAPAPLPTPKTRKPKGRVTGEKDAEGTQAPNRFNGSDIIIKSKYELNGQSLEVDTD